MIATFIDDDKFKEFCKTNNITRKIINQQPVISKINHANYGMVFYMEDGIIIYSKHKAIPINQNKPTPKVSTKIQKTFRIVTEQEIESHFDIATTTEILALELIEEKNL